MRLPSIALLLLATFSTFGFAQNTSKSGIEVVLSPQNPLHLHVTLTSGAAMAVTFYHADLPWGIRDSMIFAAVRPNGETVDLISPIDDPGPAKVYMKPGQRLTGDIDLRNVIRDVNTLKKSDVLLFWAYKSPPELRIPRWSGGLVVIPKQK